MGNFNKDCRKENVEDLNNFLNFIDKKKKVRMIFFSSIEAFGTTSKEVVEMGEKEKPVSVYGLSKLESEKVIEDYSGENKNFKYVILRLGNVNMAQFLVKYKDNKLVKSIFGEYELNILPMDKIIGSVNKILKNGNINNVKRYLVGDNMSMNSFGNRQEMTKWGWWISDRLVDLMRIMKKGGVWYYLAAGGSKKPYRRFSKKLDEELGI